MAKGPSVSWLLLVLWLFLALGAAEARAALPADPECAAEARDGPPRDQEGKDPGPCAGTLGATEAALHSENEAAAVVLSSDTDVIHYDLDLEVIPEDDGNTVIAVRVTGSNTIDFEPTVDGLTHFTLDLRSNLSVSAVTGNVATWERVGNTIEIQLDRAYDAGEPVQVRVDYGGYPATMGNGAFRWWLRDGRLVVATLSEPFFARNWWPCKDQLDDKSTVDIAITVPSELVALSNGILLGSEALAEGRTRYRWRESLPMIPYLASMAITSYESYALQYDYDDEGVPASMPVSCHYYPDNWDYDAGQPVPSYKAACDELLVMLPTFDSLFGRYPWISEKYDIVETGGDGGLTASMEHQTISSMRWVAHNSDIMAHELAHQWWGDDVTCETWYDIWLNEGFASYSEALYREFRPGGSRAAYWNRMNFRRPADADARVYRTAVGTTGQIFSLNDIYNKGSWVLHMLRHVMGDVAFFKALADYRAEFQHDSATTAEFAASISASFGADLGWFVDQWVMSHGSPDFLWSHRSSSMGGQDYLELEVWQTQFVQEMSLYITPIDIRVTTAAGVSLHRIWSDDWIEYYVLPVDGPVISAEFDAEGGVANHNWILWTGVDPLTTPFEPPPVLLHADVTHGSPTAQETRVTLTFSADIGSFDPGDVSLSGSAGALPGPDSWSYDPASQRAVLTWQALPEGDYDLAVHSAGIEANGKALDGEIDTSAWWDDVDLPSGDGQPGGDAALSFAVEATPVPGLTALPLAQLIGLLTLAALRRWQSTGAAPLVVRRRVP